jgi:REP element-mobilizing transposase RayT
VKLHKAAHTVYKTQYHIVWSKGYFVSTVGITEEIIRRYVAKQGQEDAGQAKLEF